MHIIMNILLIILVAVVGFCYFGGNKCPKVLKDNKEMLLGVLIGLALCSFMGVNLEGMNDSDYSKYNTYAFPDCPCNTGGQKGCIGYDCQHDDDCNMCGHIDNDGKAIPNYCALYRPVYGHMQEGTCQRRK